jgi:hypothetical protein
VRCDSVRRGSVRDGRRREQLWLHIKLDLELFSPEHASKPHSHSFRTARNRELTVTTGVTFPTHGAAGRHYWIASQRTICLEME